MNMMLNLSSLSVNRDLSTASTSASIETSGQGNGSFQSLLAKIAGQVNGESKTVGMNSAISLIASVIPNLSVSSEEGEGDLLAWLEQLLQQLEQMEPESLQLLFEENPDLAAVLSSFSLTNAANMLPQTTESLQLKHGDIASAGELLKGVIREWIASIKSGDTASQAAVGQAQAFRQLIQAMQLDTKTTEQLEGLTANQGASQPTNATSGTQAAWVHNGLMPRQAAADARSEQPGADDRGASQKGTNIQMANNVAKVAFLPKADLLRPELLELALGDAVETEVAESKPVETVVQTQMTLTQETLKAAADTTVARQAATQTAQVPFDRFAEHLERFVTKSFQITQQNGFAEAKISLVPEHLGQVDIKLSLQNGQLTAQIVTETTAGREALEQQLGMLRTALQAQGIQVERLEVTQQTNAASSFAFLRDQGQQQSARQFQQQSRSESAGYEEEAIDFEQELELIGNEYDALYSGRAFHAMA